MGAAVVIWAYVDLAMNVLRAAFDLARRRSPVEFCAIAEMVRLLGRSRAFLAIDTLVSFNIICAVLW